jgi:signal transduction histidine kinase
MLPGYVVMIDREHNIRFANRNFVSDFSAPGERPCHEVLYGLDAPCDDCLVPAVLDKGRTEEWEETDSNGRTYQIWTFPFVDADGTSLVLEFRFDITNRKELELLVAETSEAERRRIGRDLHDTLGQSMTGMGYLIGGLADRIAGALPEEQGTAEQIVSTVNRAIAQVRALARGLDPVGVAEEGLSAALRELTANMENISGVPCRFVSECSVSFDEFVATHLYRIAQEATNNAVRHARAKQVRITLTETLETVTMAITDDGVGLPEDPAESSGMGLRVMRYRANAIGAKLRVRSRKGGGTRVTCSLPKDQVR